MTKQIRLALTITEEEQLVIRRAYAEFLAEVNRPVSMNAWLKDMILGKVKE